MPSSIGDGRLITVGVIADYLTLWDILLTVELHLEREDKHFFRLAPDGKYSAQAAYEALFIGSTYFDPCKRVWHSWLPRNVSFPVVSCSSEVLDSRSTSEMWAGTPGTMSTL
jgi:hypothetical protein